MFGADTTLRDIVEDILDILTGSGARSPIIGTLASDITADATSVALVVSDDFRTGAATQLTRGLIEIDTELIWVESSDGTTANIPALYGRGFKNTTAAAHVAGSMVTIQPRPPRATIAAQVNRVIRNLYPRLYAVATDEQEVHAYPWTATLPADCARVLQVETRNGDSDQWVVMSAWERTHDGVTLGGPFIGTNVRFTYAKLPEPLTSLDSEWEETGLHETVKNVVRDGVLADMLTWTDIGRITGDSGQSLTAEQARPVGAGSQLSRQQYRAMYEVGVERERQRLDGIYSHKTHWIR